MVKKSGKEQDVVKGKLNFDQEKHYVLENIKIQKNHIVIIQFFLKQETDTVLFLNFEETIMSGGQSV